MNPTLRENIIIQAMGMLARGLSVQAVKLRMSGAQPFDGSFVSDTDKQICLREACKRHKAIKIGGEA